jgi:hypothetical protein
MTCGGVSFGNGHVQRLDGYAGGQMGGPTSLERLGYQSTNVLQMGRGIVLTWP